MNKAPRYIMLCGWIAAWICVFASDIANAQDLGELTGSEYEAEVSGRQREAYPEVKMTSTDSVPLKTEEYSTRGRSGIPDFIMESSYYTLGKEDVIEVQVLRHPEVSGQYIITNEGKIQYEFVGDVRIEGLKKDEVKDLLVKLLSDYIISPVVTVKIVGYNSKIVYVIGEVGRPGKIFMRGDTITVREALVLSGLPTLSAKASKCHLITPSADGKPVNKPVNVHKLLYEGDLRENLVMNPGDTLYVPPTFLAKTMRVIQPVTAPVREVGGMAGTAYGF